MFYTTSVDYKNNKVRVFDSDTLDLYWETFEFVSNYIRNGGVNKARKNVAYFTVGFIKPTDVPRIRAVSTSQHNGSRGYTDETIQKFNRKTRWKSFHI